MEQRKLHPETITVYRIENQKLRDCYLTLSYVKFKHLRKPQTPDKRLLKEFYDFSKNSISCCENLSIISPNNLAIKEMKKFFEQNCAYIKVIMNEG